MSWRGNWKLEALVREHTHAEGATRHILLELASQTNAQTGAATVSIRSLADYTGHARETVVRAITELLDLGELALVDSRKGRTRGYRILVGVLETLPRKQLWGGAKTRPPGVPGTRPPSVPGTRPPVSRGGAADQATTGTGIGPRLVGNWATGGLAPNSPSAPTESQRDQRVRVHESHDSARPDGRATDLLTETTRREVVPNGTAPGDKARAYARALADAETTRRRHE